MTSQLGHREIEEDLKTCAPSVFIVKETLFGQEKNSLCRLYSLPSYKSCRQPDSCEA